MKDTLVRNNIFVEPWLDPLHGKKMARVYGTFSSRCSNIPPQVRHEDKDKWLQAQIDPLIAEVRNGMIESGETWNRGNDVLLGRQSTFPSDMFPPSMEHKSTPSAGVKGLSGMSSHLQATEIWRHMDSDAQAKLFHGLLRTAKQPQNLIEEFEQWGAENQAVSEAFSRRNPSLATPSVASPTITSTLLPSPSLQTPVPHSPTTTVGSILPPKTVTRSELQESDDAGDTSLERRTGTLEESLPEEPAPLNTKGAKFKASHCDSLEKLLRTSKEITFSETPAVGTVTLPEAQQDRSAEVLQASKSIFVVEDTLRIPEQSKRISLREQLTARKEELAASKKRKMEQVMEEREQSSSDKESSQDEGDSIEVQGPCSKRAKLDSVADSLESEDEEGPVIWNSEPT